MDLSGSSQSRRWRAAVSAFATLFLSLQVAALAQDGGGQMPVPAAVPSPSRDGAALVEPADGARGVPSVTSPTVPVSPPSIMQNAGLQPSESPEQQKLHGMAQFRSVAATASTMPVTRLKGCKRDLGLRCVRLCVKNNSDMPMTILGDCATADGAGFKGASAANLMLELRRSGCGMTRQDAAFLGLVGVSTLYFAAPMLYERLTDPPGGVTSGTAFGRDGARHKVEAVRMDNRLIMPGDETEGLLCFDTATFPISVRVPVISGQAGALAGELELPVQPAR